MIQAAVRRRPRYTSVRSQQGQAILALLMVLGIGAATLIYTYMTGASASIATNKKTAAALAQAKDALIGYAAGQVTGGTFRPGELPCPDTNDDGSEEANCNTQATRIGRLPWKTLGLPDPRDGAGERLWYAVSNVFKNATQTGVLNSDTAGELTVRDGTGATSSSNVIAIVFAPGGVVGAQDRNPSTNAACTTTGTTIARSLCATNYLENGNEDGADTLFTSTPSTTAFNDTLLLITSDVLFPAVEQRVLTELRASLRTYRTNNGYFPSASTFASTSCNYTTMQGRLPLNINLGCAAFANWGAELPSWFAANNWHQVTYYAVSACRVGVVGGLTGFFIALLCAGGDLDVAGTSGVHAAFFTAGRGLTGQTRPCTNVSDCLDDALNQDGNNSFISPVRSADNNDRGSIVWP